MCENLFRKYSRLCGLFHELCVFFCKLLTNEPYLFVVCKIIKIFSQFLHIFCSKFIECICSNYVWFFKMIKIPTFSVYAIYFLNQAAEAQNSHQIMYKSIKRPSLNLRCSLSISEAQIYKIRRLFPLISLTSSNIILKKTISSGTKKILKIA